MAANFPGHSSNSLESEITGGSQKTKARALLLYVGDGEAPDGGPQQQVTLSRQKDKIAVNTGRVRSGARLLGSKYQRHAKLLLKLKKKNLGPDKTTIALDRSNFKVRSVLKSH